MSTPPATFVELIVAPAAGTLAWRQAARALGPRRAALELLALVAYGYALELVAIAVFASHAYGDAWRLAPGGVPIAVALGWASLILGSAAAAWRLGVRTSRGLAAAAALVAVSVDLVIEPVAVRAGLWRWTPPGGWLGVPIGNFVGWAVIVGVYVYGAERFQDVGAIPAQVVQRLALATLAIVALVAVGVLWTRLDAERAFTDGRAAAVAGATLLPLFVLTRRERPPAVEPGLAARLGAAGRPWTLGVIGGAFAAQALWLGEPALWGVSAAVMLVLARVLAK